MCVRVKNVKKWREDAQPEWPEAAPGTQDIPTAGGTTQTFSETGETGATGVPADDGNRDFPGAPRADRGEDAPEPAGRRAVVRDPWDESGSGAGHAHDPHEVTVQLDGVGLNGDERIEGRPGGEGGSESSDGPVFVDESGRRSRRFRRIGIAVGLACAVYAVVIVVTLLSGNSNAPWLPVTGPKDDAPAGEVDTSPMPAESAEPSLPAGVIPGTTPTVSGGVTPAPGAGVTAPGATMSPGKPGTSADPSATATQPGGKPSVSADPSTQPTQSVTPPPSPSVTPPVTTSPDPSVAPTETTGGGSAGPGTVADGPPSPAPVASETSGAPAPVPSGAPLSSPSPEQAL
ncbi:hypothetical protein QFZ22_006138 [Streptomyces canus]|uniref:Translation initiation factor IF-2 n=1 Tax=Streptomyces canus TaxID=58343 RepID=A0AAW8FJS4_9ACTN|nr:hypothetical protein [Streptomyces canus]